jgi:hypothetical protein
MSNEKEQTEERIDARRDRKNSNWLALGLFIATILSVYVVVRANGETAAADRQKTADAVTELQHQVAAHDEHFKITDAALTRIEKDLAIIKYILDPHGDAAREMAAKKKTE